MSLLYGKFYSRDYYFNQLNACSNRWGYTANSCWSWTGMQAYKANTGQGFQAHYTKPPEHWRPMRKIALNFLPINQNRPWQPFPPTATYPNDVVAGLLLTPAVSTSPLPYLVSIFKRLPCKSRFFWNVH